MTENQRSALLSAASLYIKYHKDIPETEEDGIASDLAETGLFNTLGAYGVYIAPIHDYICTIDSIQKFDKEYFIKLIETTRETASPKYH